MHLFIAKRASRLLTPRSGSIPINSNFLFNSCNAAWVDRIVIVILIDHYDIAIVELGVKIAVLHSVNFSFLEFWWCACVRIWLLNTDWFLTDNNVPTSLLRYVAIVLLFTLSA